MKKPQDIAVEQRTMGTIVGLTSAFEGLSSMKIAQIKSEVLQSQRFFQQLWEIYTQIRVDSIFHFGRNEDDKTEVIDKELYLAVTGEGGFSGDIDQKLITWMLKTYDPAKNDIVIIGHHGAIQLTQAGITFKKYFKMPSKDKNINVTPLVQVVKSYRNTTLYYQTYVSLMVQDIKHIELSKVVQEAGAKIDKATELTEVISTENYIFEPSVANVVAHLEGSMLEVALSQAILDSKLAQHASRFRAMSVAKQRAQESQTELRILYNRSKRAIADEHLKESLNGMKKAAHLG